jgi:hypothetical protein
MPLLLPFKKLNFFTPFKKSAFCGLDTEPEP